MLRIISQILIRDGEFFVRGEEEFGVGAVVESYVVGERFGTGLFLDEDFIRGCHFVRQFIFEGDGFDILGGESKETLENGFTQILGSFVAGLKALGL